MQGPCSVDGNIGMPLQLSGEIQVADKEKLGRMLPNDFTFSFASFRTRPSIDNNGSIILPGSGTNTINFQGATYTLISLRATDPQHLNFSDNQAKVFLEIIATFQNTRPSKEAPFLFMLCFPFYSDPNGSKNKFVNAVFNPSPMTSTASIQDMVSEVKDFAFYTSCIPMIGKASPEIKSLSCSVLVASRALPLYKAGNWPHRFYLMPSMYLMDYDTIVEFKLENFKFAPSSIKRGPNGRTYSATILTTGDQFTKRFSLYSYDKALLDQANQQQCKPSNRLATNQLKCFPIKAKQDIKSGILLIDPKTGKRMDTYLLEQDAANNPPPKPNDVGKSIAKILGIVIGSLAAIVVIGFFSVYFFKFNPEAKGDASAPFKAHVKVGKAGGADGAPFKAHVKVGKAGGEPFKASVKVAAAAASTAEKKETPPTEEKDKPALPPTASEPGAQPQPATPEGQVGNADELNNSAVVAEVLPKPIMAASASGEKPVRGRAVTKETPVARQASITPSTSPVPEARKAERSRSPSPERPSVTPIATADRKEVEAVNVSSLGQQPSIPPNIPPSPRPGKTKVPFDQPAGLAPETKNTNILGIAPQAST
jgi:hypothetical protein